MDEFELFKECAKVGSSLPGTPRLRKHTDPECGSIYHEKIEAKRKSVSDYTRKLGKKPLSRLNSSPGLFRHGSINSSGRPSLTESENELEIYRVRSFRTKKRSIVYRGDSYKIRKSPSIQSVSTINSNCASIEDIVPTFRVLVLGSVNVGKTCIIKQFLTSEYVGAIPNEEDREDSNVTVSLDGQEIVLIFSENTNDSQTIPDVNIDAYVVVYAINEKETFDQVRKILLTLTLNRSHNLAIILVGNKQDIVRKRTVSNEVGRRLAEKYDCKFIEVSALLNHKIDDLLVGIAAQIRLKRINAEKRKLSETLSIFDRFCYSRSGGSLLKKFFKRNSLRSRSCENLLIS